jgi:hypothetical protein
MARMKRMDAVQQAIHIMGDGIHEDIIAKKNVSRMHHITNNAF